ncbi:MAG: toprim domain-containing protein [Acidimicrobiales bacterium]
MSYDRDELLRRIALDELCDELLGPRKGRGRFASWRCPSPTHGPQTGRTPPLTVFTSRVGEQRWRCHACGAGGTALDLVMISNHLGFADALEALARRCTLRPTDRPSAALRSAEPRPVAALAPPPPNPVIERYVAACERVLASPTGADIRWWLFSRGFSLPLLAANRVGADPGPQRLSRPKGLPRGGPGAVFPVLEHREAVYAQLRCLDEDKLRWTNPSAHIATSPHLASILLAGPPRRPDLLMVTEGMTDALTAADAGYPAVALLGVGLADEAMAKTLAQRWPDRQLVVAFDAGGPGRSGSRRLVALLAEQGAAKRTSALQLPRGVDDLNDWRQVAGRSFGEQLDRVAAKSGPVDKGVGQAFRAGPAAGMGLA